MNCFKEAAAVVVNRPLSTAAVDKVHMKQFKAKILENKKIAPDHYTLSFIYKNKDTVEPGQFFNIRVSDSYQPLLRRPFGAHSLSKNKIEILYKIVGKATEILSMKKKGDALDIIGPLGNGFVIKPQLAVCAP